MATPVADSISLTGNALVDGVTQGGAWTFSGSRVLTYSFNLNFEVAAGGGFIAGAGGSWTTPLSDAFARAVAAWSSVANIGFQQITSGSYTYESSADIAATLTGDDLAEIGGAALGIPPDADVANQLLAAIELTRMQYPRPEGDVFFDNYYQGYQYLYDGGFGFDAMVHELGHALGLKHPDDDGANGRPTFASLGISQYDTDKYTIMSNVESGTVSSGNAATPMPLDILAIQHIYGANLSHHADNDTYSIVADANNPLRTIWDAGGNDTIDAATLAPFSGATIDLRPGIGYVQSASGGYTAIAYNVTIENALGGAGNDTLIGNDAANTLDGRIGFDTLRGGPGNDTYLSDGDVVVENPGEGTDTIITAFTTALPAEVENLTLTGTGSLNGSGNALGNYIVGNSAVNLLSGGAGNDVLDGGAGIDVMQGGPGDDVYYVDSAVATGGTYLSISNWYGSSYLFTPATGNFNLQASDYSGDPDTLVDTVTLYYLEPSATHFFSVDVSTRMLSVPLAPGTYVDTMRYPFESSGHPGLWIAGDGIGANTSTGSFTATAANFTYSNEGAQIGQFVVNFTYSGDGGQPVTGTLSVNGPAGVQTDAVSEAPNEGSDIVRSLIDYALPPNVEILELIGTNPINGLGNEMNNQLAGNDAANVLDGATGNDAMLGGKGDDTYYVDSLFDVVIEATAEGTDEVRSAISYTLGANLENLTLIGAAGASGTGNASPNAVTGNTAGNLLDGAAGNDLVSGGIGNDTVIGGPGNDTLVGDGGLDTAQYSSARAAYSVSRSDATTTVSGPDGTDSLLGVERLQFADGIVRLGGRPIVDFSGETKTDFVLRHDNGTIEYRLMDGVNLAGFKDDPIPTYWSVVSTNSDFNGDGKSDVVLRHDNGTIEYRLMDGVNLAGFTDDPIPTYWSVVSTDSDFNGDGKSDVVIRNVDGTIEYRLMDGLTFAGYRDDFIPTYWKVVSTDSDFNADGKSDVVLRHDSGIIEYRLMDGVNLAGYRDDVIPTSWKVVSTDSDFNADGKSDVVIRNDSGIIEYRLMDGVNLAGYRDDVIPTSWKIVSTDSDFNGDGKSDVVLRHDNGTIEYRLMDGVNMTAFLDDPIPAYWSVFTNEPTVLTP